MVMNYVDVLHKGKPTDGPRNRPGGEAAGPGVARGGGAPGHAAGIPETPCAGRPRLTAESRVGPTRTPPPRFPTK